jgi:probable HAF family extracellular repeat protein
MSIGKFLLPLLLLLLSAPAAQAQQLAYEMTLIPRLDYANGINDLGQIAGNAFGPDGTIQAAVWTPGAAQPLRFLGPQPDYASDINNAGQVTGQHQFTPGQWRAAIFSNGAIQDLGGPGSASSIGRAINASGQVAGALGNDPLHGHAFFYSNGQMRDLGAFSGDHSDAYGINDAGQVVGTALVIGAGGAPNTWRAFEYSGGAINELDIGGAYSIAWDINNAGQVVGEWNPLSEGGSHAFVYKDGDVMDLGNLGGDNTYALSINERGAIVGHGTTGRGDTLHGFIYVDGKLVDLNTLLVAPNGWQVTRTSAINGGLKLAGLACRIDNEFECMPALLSPVPEPAASVLLSGGLLLLLASRCVRRLGHNRGSDTRRTSKLASCHGHEGRDWLPLSQPTP